MIDVGVARGTRELYEAFPDANYLLIEPLSERTAALERIVTSRVKGEYVIAAVGSAAGVATLHVEPTASAKSSVLERTAATSTGDELEQREVPVVTIDGVVDERGLEGPFGLKIDTEGFEVEVIRGATKTLEQCQFVIVETSTAPDRFEKGYRSGGLIRMMRKHGFIVYDVLRTSRRFADLLFLPARDPRLSRRSRKAGHRRS